jgi:DNA-binding CsgD family transcriptional regulator
MLVMPATELERCAPLDAGSLSVAINAIGTSRYGEACFQIFEQSLDADHWAVFVHRANHSVHCIASASRVHAAAAKESVRRFVTYGHSADPSLTAATTRAFETGCIVNMDIDDIQDVQYRRCFEATGVRERLSLYARQGADLRQLSIYRSARRRTFSSPEVRHFTVLANVMLATAGKHEMLSTDTKGVPPQLDLAAIERLLERIPAQLSRREREVCACAAVGKTILGTALDLGIERSSVITYRHRAYQKLGISCQNELVALVMNVTPR